MSRASTRRATAAAIRAPARASAVVREGRGTAGSVPIHRGPARPRPLLLRRAEHRRRRPGGRALHRGRHALLHPPRPPRGRAHDRRAHALGGREHRRAVGHRERDRGRRARRDRVDDDLEGPRVRRAAPGPRHRVVRVPRRQDRRGARLPPRRARRTRAATCWASTTPAEGTPRCEGVQQGSPARRAPAADPAVHRGALRAARVDPAVRGRGAAAPRHRVGGRALVPRRGVPEAGRRRLPRPEVPGGVRRPGRRLRARRRVHRGAGRLRLGRHGGGDRRARRDRHAAGVQVRHRGPEAALPRAGDQGRADRRAGHHRAGRGVRRGGHPHVRRRRSTAATW